ncbi:hypothetical protein [Streptomyces sp. TRM75563]|uniref:hypothetical protein n=1 Tax=Streptomyces sp. TRM75563 TaxID=2817418 RepID=UPI001F6115AA|nr:hypothetical protein [Streptomyces sp. TRM75563]MCI4040017.1 hypothetical protein [Streptomyces sp. TRM75563]
MDELADGRVAAPGGEDDVELADEVLGPGGLNSGEHVNGPVPQGETLVEVAGLKVAVASRVPTERVKTAEGTAAADWYRASY